MSQTNYLYFAEGLTFIDNLTGSELPNVNRQNYINSLCDTYERTILRMVFGVEFADAFISGLAETVIPERWTALKGKIWVVTITGADPNEITTYHSFIANYVWRKYWNIKQVNVGEGSDFQDKENAVLALARASEVWNTMVEEINDVQDWLKTNQANYVDDPTIILNQIPIETIL